MLFDRGTWPASWTDRIGMHSAHHDIYIVELELWGALLMLRTIIPLAGARDGRSGGRLRVFNDNQSIVGMLSKLTTTSRRCLPLIKEIVGLLVVSASPSSSPLQVLRPDRTRTCKLQLEDRFSE